MTASYIRYPLNLLYIENLNYMLIIIFIPKLWEYKYDIFIKIIQNKICISSITFSAMNKQ